MSPPDRRRRALVSLYGEAAGAAVGRQVDHLLARYGITAVPALSERSAWLIAYPDHVRHPGIAPLAALDRFLSTRLAPWVSGVHTLPLHPSSGDGGFSVIDPSVVEPRFGGWGDVETLALHHSWMADAVVNHLSASSPWFTRFLAAESPFDSFFATLDPTVDASAVVRPRTSPLSHAFVRPDGSSVDVWTTFSADQVDLDYRSPQALLAMTEVICDLVAHGAAALRLDAIAFAWKDAATPSMSLPETHALVQFWRACLDQIRPGLLLITETNVAHAENISYFGSGQMPEAGAVYQFSLPPLVLHTMLTGDCTVLSAWAAAQDPPRPGCTFANMLATHDGIGVRGAEGWLSDDQVAALAAATEAAGGVVNWRSTPGGNRPYELAVSWFALLAHGYDDAAALARHHASYAICLALRGFPLLWFNALFAVGNDDVTYARTGHGRDLNRARAEDAALSRSLDDEGSLAHRCWNGFRRMLAQRSSSAAFAPESSQRIVNAGSGVFMVERVAATGQRAVVAVNITAQATGVMIPGGPKVGLGPWGTHWHLEGDR